MSMLGRASLFASVLAAGALTLATPAAAQTCSPTSGGGWHYDPAGSTPGCVPLLPPPGGTVTGTLAGNDDGSTPTISLASAFPGGLNFFGGPFTSVVVNNNGNVTFGGSLYTYTPRPFPIPRDGSTSYPMIAPYWADIDTRGGGAPSRNYVWYYLEPGRMIVTWSETGYYNTHDDRKMSIQLIITNAAGCGTGDFDVEFRYNKCEWTTGDASGGSRGFGGTPAQVGFDALNGRDYVAVPRSGTMAILDQCTTSNVGMPGVWRFSVHGGVVSCPGTGTPCDTGMLGACGIGVTQCIASGTSCVPVGTPSAERCDGVDNDCNGSVDEGEGLCPPTTVCYQGACVPPCFEGACPTGQVCAEGGTCVDAACIGVTCPANQRCRGGSCVDACDGVTCPHAEQCIAGRCITLCDVITCGEGEVCQDGVCQPDCTCHPCPAGSTCLADGSCSVPGCDLVHCGPGEYCEGGSCYDACAGATCPEGQRCELGHCIDGPATPDAGIPTDVDAGTIPEGIDAAITLIDASHGEPDAGRSRRRGGGSDCGCRVASSRAPAPAWLLGLGALAFALWRRRR